MKNLMILSLIVTVSVSTVGAQSVKVQTAYRFMQDLDFESAVAPINEAILDPKTGVQAKTWYYRGGIYQQLYIDTNLRKKHPEAVKESVRSFKKAMIIDPKNQWKDEIKRTLMEYAYLYYNEGVAPFNNKEYQAAYDNFKATADLYAFMNDSLGEKVVDTLATLYAGNSALKLKHYDDAEKQYESLLQRGISLPEIYSSLGDVYVVKGDTAKAVDIVDKGRKLYPDDKTLMISELNFVLAKKDDSKSIEKLNDAIKMEPDNILLYILLGDRYDKMKDTANAHAAYRKAIEKEPNNSIGYYQLGVSYYDIAYNINKEMNKLPDSQQKQIDAMKVQRNAMFTKSLAYLERAHQIDPKDKETLEALKQIYAVLNMLDKMEEVKKEIEALGG